MMLDEKGKEIHLNLASVCSQSSGLQFVQNTILKLIVWQTNTNDVLLLRNQSWPRNYICFSFAHSTSL